MVKSPGSYAIAAEQGRSSTFGRAFLLPRLRLLPRSREGSDLLGLVGRSLGRLKKGIPIAFAVQVSGIFIPVRRRAFPPPLARAVHPRVAHEPARRNQLRISRAET